MKCKLFSQRKHPITLSYEGRGVMLPPRGCIVIADKKRLGAVPKGVILVDVED